MNVVTGECDHTVVNWRCPTVGACTLDIRQVAPLSHRILLSLLQLLLLLMLMLPSVALIVGIVRGLGVTHVLRLAD